MQSSNHISMPQLPTIIASYLFFVNLIAFVLYGIDKKRAIQHKFRIPEKKLLWMARIGGGIGSWLGIKIFHHKTKHTKFKIVVPLWTVIWFVAIILMIDNP